VGAVSSNRRDVRDFLVSRRAKITPRQAGLTVYGGNRRVPGLRREEAAMLAGLSVDYYTRLEKGNLAGASDSVLHAIADALHLDEAERAHLLDLARATNTSIRAPRRRPATTVRPSVQHILDGMTDVPAFVRNGRLDILAVTRLGRALYAPVFDSPTRTNKQAAPNLARFRFLDSAAVEFYPDWSESANTTVNLLRTEAGRDPHNKDLIALVGELSTRSEDFRTRWAAHNVRLHVTGTKKFHHPVVGDMSLSFEAMQISADEGLTLTAYAAGPGSASADALKLLASWAATLDTVATQAPQAIEQSHEG
jgi:transcriptional regulator with XRE-family HTH domain